MHASLVYSRCCEHICAVRLQDQTLDCEKLVTHVNCKEALLLRSGLFLRIGKAVTPLHTLLRFGRGPHDLEHIHVHLRSTTMLFYKGKPCDTFPWRSMASHQVQHFTESWPFSTELEGVLCLLQEDCLILSVS